jgi:hypothetical protein
LVPWYKVAVNLIGPWTPLIQGHQIEFYALTCIDLVSNSIVYIARIENKSAAHVGMIFENNWLARYPKPGRCLHDNGRQFIGARFLRILAINGTKGIIPTMIKNAQSNAICERMHQTAGNTLCTLTRAQPPQSIQQVNHFVDSAMAMTMHATRCDMHHVLGMSPGAFVFQDDMFRNIPLIDNL